MGIQETLEVVLTICKEIYPYEQAEVEFCASSIRTERNNRPLLNWLGEGRITRHGGIIRNIQGDNPLDQGFASIFGTAKIDHDVIRNTDINAYLTEIRKMGESIAEQQSKNFFANLNEMFDHPNSPALTIDLSDLKQNEND